MKISGSAHVQYSSFLLIHMSIFCHLFMKRVKIALRTGNLAAFVVCTEALNRTDIKNEKCLLSRKTNNFKFLFLFSKCSSIALNI